MTLRVIRGPFTRRTHSPFFPAEEEQTDFATLVTKSTGIGIWKKLFVFYGIDHIDLLSAFTRLTVALFCSISFVPCTSEAGYPRSQQGSSAASTESCRPHRQRVTDSISFCVCLLVTDTDVSIRSRLGTQLIEDTPIILAVYTRFTCPSPFYSSGDDFEQVMELKIRLCFRLLAISDTNGIPRYRHTLSPRYSQSLDAG